MKLLLLLLVACGGSEPAPSQPTRPPPAMPSNHTTSEIAMPPPATKPAPDGSDAGWPPGCQDYRAEILVLMNCDKLPAESRDAMNQGFQAMSQGFAQWEQLPPDARAQALDAANQGCKAGADAIKQSLAAMGC